MESDPESWLQAFRYAKLNDTSSDLRLIEIEPGRTSDGMRCIMHTYALAQCPSYEALSYAWGDSASKMSIVLRNENTFGNKVFMVTANLFSALLNLRKCRSTGQPRDQRLLVWIDALCIDQQDLEERNDQVQRMKSIYQRAKRVIVYLGDYDEASDRRLQFAPQTWGIDGLDRGSYSLTLAAFTIAMHLSSLTNVASEGERIQILAESSLRDQTVSPLASIHGWAQLSRLFHRTWFERLWVIQELGVSEEALVLCGGITIPWPTIEDAAAFILRPHLATPPEIRRFFPLMGAHRVTQVALKAVSDVDKLNILTIVRHTQGASCSDHRDRLYAILGVTQDTHDIAINYSKPFEAVFRHWAILRILRTKSLDVLSACADSSSTGELPSWVPDLRRPWAHDRALWRITHQLSPKNRASRPEYLMHIPPNPTTWQLDDLFQDNHLQLSVDGLPIGTISSLTMMGDAVTDLPDPTDLTSRLHNIVTSWEQWCHPYHPIKPYRATFGAIPDYPFRNTLLRQSHNIPGWIMTYEHWRHEVGTLSSPFNTNPTEAQSILRNFEAALFSLAHGCQMFVMENLGLGIVAGNCNCQPGDEIWLLQGGLTPFILRREVSGHRLITPCYLDGYMEGRLISYLNSPMGPPELRKVVLV